MHVSPIFSGILIHAGRTYRDPHMCTLYPEQLRLPEAQPSSAWLKYANVQEKLRNERKQNQILQWMRKLARSQGFASPQDANNFKDQSEWKHKCGKKIKFSPKSTAGCFFCCFGVKRWGHSQSFCVFPSFVFLEIPAMLKSGLLQCCRRIITQTHQRLLLPMPAFAVYAVHCVFKLQTARVSGGPREMSDKCTSSPFAESLMPVETSALTALKAFQYANAAHPEKSFTVY